MAELGRLHASVAPVPEAEIRTVLAARLGRPIDEGVVQVRRPGLERIVDRDLAIAGWLARHVTEIAAAVEDEPRVPVPHVVDELTRDGVRVLERRAGRTLAELGSERPANPRELADALCGSQLRAMLRVLRTRDPGGAAR